MKTHTTTCLALLALATLLGPGAAALAQEEDDHTSTTTGHDPATENRGELKTTELEGDKMAIEVDHTFGLGYAQTPGGLTGAEAEYYLAPNLMLEGILSLALFSPSSGSSTTFLGLGVGAFYRWKLHENVALMLGGRVDVGHLGAGGSGATKLPQTYPSGSDATQFNLEFMLRLQVYLGILAIHAEVGPVLAIIDSGGGVIGESWQSVPKGVYLDLPSNNLIASFGAVIYFGH